MNKVKRKPLLYIPLIGFIIAIGLPARLIPQYLPSWYILYFGDLLWAMLVFFLYGLLFHLSTKYTFCLALATAFLIELSQLFHPAWLEYLRSIRLLAFVFGFGFLWSDLIAYTLGISLAAGIDWLILSSKKKKAVEFDVALDETRIDYQAGRFVAENVAKHIHRITKISKADSVH